MSVTFQALARHYYREMKEISFRNDILPLKDKLYRLALRITFDTAEAEDIVQETLIRVWDKRNEWPQLNSIEAYCLTICRHLSLDRSEKEIAAILNLSEEQVKVYLFRARQRIKQKYTEIQGYGL